MNKLRYILAGLVLLVACIAAIYIVTGAVFAGGLHPGSCDLQDYSPELHEHVDWLDELTGGDVPYLCFPVPPAIPTPTPMPIPTPMPTSTPEPAPTPDVVPALWITEIAVTCYWADAFYTPAPSCFDRYAID